MASNDSGNLNVAFGTRTLSNNDSGSQNIAIGHRALEANSNGSNNTSLGYGSLLLNQGSSNIAVGSSTPRNLITGNSNVFLGTETAINLLHGINNVLLGNRIALEKFPSTPLLAGYDTNKTIIIGDGYGNQQPIPAICRGSARDERGWSIRTLITDDGESQLPARLGSAERSAPPNERLSSGSLGGGPGQR